MIYIPSSYGRSVTNFNELLTLGYPLAPLDRVPPSIDTLLFVIEYMELPTEVVSALVLLHSILKGKASMNRDKRIKTISEIYFIVFFKYPRIWTHETLLLVHSIFNIVARSPFNRRTVWIRWEVGFTAADFLYADDSKNNEKDARYNEYMSELMDSIADAEKDEIFDTHHPCEYESVLGIQGDSAMDFVPPQHAGLEEARVILIGE